MGSTNRSSHGVESKTLGLGRELDESKPILAGPFLYTLGTVVGQFGTNLDLGSDMEESKVSGD